MLIYQRVSILQQFLGLACPPKNVVSNDSIGQEPRLVVPGRRQRHNTLSSLLQANRSPVGGGLHR